MAMQLGEFAALVNYPGIEKLRDYGDQPRTANAAGVYIAHGDNHRFQGLGMDIDVFNGTVACPHPMFNAAAFKGRAGGAGGTNHPAAVADNNLPVGADVDKKAYLFADMHLTGMNTRNNIPAHIGGDAGIEKEADRGVSQNFGT